MSTCPARREATEGAITLAREHPGLYVALRLPALELDGPPGSCSSARLVSRASTHASYAEARLAAGHHGDVLVLDDGLVCRCVEGGAP
jgi:hypothetical protein